MHSPFPGMDPFLEAKWPEMHARLIVYAANQINPQLPNDLQANIEENVAVCAEGDNDRVLRPDVHVSADQSRAAAAGPGQASGVAVAEPLVVPRPAHPSRHIEIVSSAGRVITAIEFISPWNKVGVRARAIYLRKQLDYIEAPVNLVEIDLIRQGRHVLSVALADLPPRARSAYLISVFRAAEPDHYEVYPAPLPEPLPNIPIPLRPGERDVVLQLQPLIDACYRDGRYHRLDYQRDPPPAFDAELAQWIDARLRQQGRRT